MQKRHYSYVIHNRNTGEYYIGIRSCAITIDPNDDLYMGSPHPTVRARIKAEGPDVWWKFILAEYATRKAAVRDEPSLIRGHLDNGKCMNRSVGGRDGWHPSNLSKDTKKRMATKTSESMKRKWAIPSMREKWRTSFVNAALRKRPEKAHEVDMQGW